MDIDQKILCECGEFYINEIYNINDFLWNTDLVFFKVEVEFCSSQSSIEITLEKQPRYIIITDVHILMFVPDVIDKHFGRLIFVGEIKNIQSIKGTKVFSSRKSYEDKEKDKDILQKSTGLIINWNNTDTNKINDVILIESAKTNLFIDSLQSRIKRLKEKFLFFQSDYTKVYFNLNKNENDLKNVVNLIEYREKLFNQSGGKDEHNLKELMILYQHVIEISSARNDEKSTVFMNRLHELIKFSKRKDKSEEDFFLIV